MNALLRETNDAMREMVSLERFRSALDTERLVVAREYLAMLDDPSYSVQPVEAVPGSQICLIRITRIVNTQNMTAQLSMVYRAMTSLADTLFLLIDGEPERVSIYLGVRGVRNEATESALLSGLRGHLPGIEATSLGADDSARVVQRTLNNHRRHIASVSAVPALQGNDPEHRTAQGLDRFIDAMRGKAYTAVILAAPMSREEIRTLKAQMQELYRVISAAARTEIQYSSSASNTVQNNTANNRQRSINEGSNTANTDTSGTATTNNRGRGPNLHIGGRHISVGLGGQRGIGSSETTQRAVTNGNQTGRQQSVGITVTEGTTSGTGRSCGNSMVIENREMQDTLARLDANIKRTQAGEALGLWECAAFFLAARPSVACVAAERYKALICGETSWQETVATNLWNASNPQAEILRQSLAQFAMPTFRWRYGTCCTPGSLVNGNELALLLNLPQKEVSGVVVTPMAAFARGVHYMSQPAPDETCLDVGHVNHMGNVEGARVPLLLNSLSSHMLVAGSTGNGKSVFISELLSEMPNYGVRFLLVEPVKGEYKELLGRMKDLTVYTLSPLHYQMLRINPFAFEDGVNLLTHVDRLIEVLQVCWPLYAAQPAMLRDCILRAYVQCGWDTGNSIYIGTGVPRFPTFRTLLDVLPVVIAESHFAGESKGTYDGALRTRIMMLVNGTYGQVLNSAVSLSDTELFERNVIVDLSAGASQEVISLLMGLLVIRLREYLSRKITPTNQHLRHLTVLEEAHNILPRHQERNAEGGQTTTGQSVRMIANAIGECRTYGEGFILSDNAPDNLDTAAIRNTATKVIFGLSESGDREAIADALSLTREQAEEFSRLPPATAIIMQRNWIQPVLTRIHPARWRYRIDQPIPQDSYAQLTRCRGALVHALLVDARQARFNPRQFLHLIDTSSLLPGTRDNLCALVLAYYREYRSVLPEFGSGPVQTEFYSRFLTEFLQCQDLFSHVQLPSVRQGMTRPYEKDTTFRADCITWQRKAENVLQRYAVGLSNEDARLALRYLLIGKQTPLANTVHNALYGAYRAVPVSGR